VSRSWSFYVPPGPGKNDQYGMGRRGSHVFLTDEAKEWRALVAEQLLDEPVLAGAVEIVIVHVTDDTGRDDWDHQAVALCDAITKAAEYEDTGRVRKGKPVLKKVQTLGWADDKQVKHAHLHIIPGQGAECGVYVWAYEIEAEPA
jgi:Holliday junction resolvase RusA-like endonuclease